MEKKFPGTTRTLECRSTKNVQRHLHCNGKKVQWYKRQRPMLQVGLGVLQGMKHETGAVRMTATKKNNRKQG